MKTKVVIISYFFLAAGGGTSVYEARLEEKRNILRRALKREYIRKMYDPRIYGKDHGPDVFDAAFHRWQATREGGDYQVRNNFWSFFFHFALIVGPMCVLGRIMKECQVGYFKKDFYFLLFSDVKFLKRFFFLQKEYEQQCQAGNVPYDGRGRRVNWYN